MGWGIGFGNRGGGGGEELEERNDNLYRVP